MQRYAGCIDNSLYSIRRSLEGMIADQEEILAQLRQYQAHGVILYERSYSEDDVIFFYTYDKKVAKRFGFEPVEW